MDSLKQIRGIQWKTEGEEGSGQDGINTAAGGKTNAVKEWVFCTKPQFWWCHQFSLKLSLSTVQTVAWCIELAEHQSPSVPWVLLVPFAEQKVSTSNSSAFTDVTETIPPQGCSQAGIWKCWCNYSGTTYFQALRLTSRIMRVASEGLNNLYSYTCKSKLMWKHLLPSSYINPLPGDRFCWIPQIQDWSQHIFTLLLPVTLQKSTQHLTYIFYVFVPSSLLIQNV